MGRTSFRFAGEACTIVLRGATQQILDEAERSLHDALCVLTTHVKDARTVYGGGKNGAPSERAVYVPSADKIRERELRTRQPWQEQRQTIPCWKALFLHFPSFLPIFAAFWALSRILSADSSTFVRVRSFFCPPGASEMLMAVAVQELAASTAGKEAVAMESFARALAQLPTIIADNAGYDSADILARLRAAHNDGNKKSGIGQTERGEAVHFFRFVISPPECFCLCL